MASAVIRYKPNEIRLAAINFVCAAIAYTLPAYDLIRGKNIFSYKGNQSIDILEILFAGEVAFCVGCLILALYQRRYNRRLITTGTFVNRWYFSERVWNYITTAVLFGIGCYLSALTWPEIRSGTASGGLFFQNQTLTDAPNMFWQLVYLHIAVSAAPIVLGLYLLLFRPKKM